jgi:hypothetical protein
MWWERWIPKSSLIKGSVCGVECVFSDHAITYYYTILQVKKNKVVVLQSGAASALTDILEIAKKHSSAIVLSLCGKGIIVKRIIFSENDSLQLKDLLQQHLPTITSTDFYAQFYKNAESSGNIVVCRKEQVNDVLNQFANHKTELANVFIGPLVCNALSFITSGYNRLISNTHQIELTNGFVETLSSKKEDDSFTLVIDDLNISSSQVVSFASGFSYLTQQTNYVSDNVELSKLPQAHFEKIKTRFLLAVLIVFVFLISGINSVLFFQKYDENSSLEVELNLYESKNNQITQLLDSYQKKKNLIEQSGIFENKKMSVCADKIAASLPDEILLRELYFNPEEGETEEDSLTNFMENQLVIKGNCSKSLILNEWINILKSQSFIKNVNLETFIYNSEGHLPNFVLKVDTQ